MPPLLDLPCPAPPQPSFSCPSPASFPSSRARERSSLRSPTSCRPRRLPPQPAAKLRRPPSLLAAPPLSLPLLTSFSLSWSNRAGVLPWPSEPRCCIALPSGPHLHHQTRPAFVALARSRPDPIGRAPSPLPAAASRSSRTSLYFAKLSSPAESTSSRRISPPAPVLDRIRVVGSRMRPPPRSSSFGSSSSSALPRRCCPMRLLCLAR
ncbi:hypothetical protein VPH35_137265 [Triticum aestivum]